MIGIDLAEEMVAVAHERAGAARNGRLGSIRAGRRPREKFAEPFDIIWSRDAFMHIPDKARLFSRLYDLSAPGGRLVITDYARGKTPGSPEFEKYIETTGYNVVEPESIRPAPQGRRVHRRHRRRRDGAVHRDPQERNRPTGRQSGVSRVVLRSRLEIPGRSLGNESRLLPGRLGRPEY